MLAGDDGAAAKFAMGLIVRTAEISGAEELVDISWAHVASAYYQGQVNLDFAEKLASMDAHVRVPTTLTACSLDIRQADAKGGAPAVQAALRIVDLYRDMGCQTVMTCSPYHTRKEPEFAEQLAWTESSAVVYANSVLGARSNRYFEFVDMCAAITGRVPCTGLHRTRERRATILLKLVDMPPAWVADDRFYHVLGFLLGRTVGSEVPAIDGLPSSVSTEQLRAIGAAANASGAVNMFHVVGVTPEAKTMADAFQGVRPQETFIITPSDIRTAATNLDTSSKAALTAVCVGAPHFSIAEFEQLLPLVGDNKIDTNVHFYVSTSAYVLDEIRERGWLDSLQAAGVEFITDRCTYYAPAIEGCDGRVMTNSAKWAYYAPGMLGSAVTFAGLDECVESAIAGKVILGSEF
jgi:predicted aconitase